MKRTTIMLPAELHSRATRLARNKGLSLGALIRESLEAQLAGRASPQEDSMFADHAVYRDSGPTDMASRHDNYLYGDDA